MLTKRNTKELLCDSIFELLKQKPLKSITVREISQNCGVSIRSFYYHFKDREDLVFYMAKRKMLETMQNTPLEVSFHDIIQTLLNNIFRYYSFIKPAIHYEGQNNLFDTAIHDLEKMLVERVCKINHTDTLDQKTQYAIAFWLNGFMKTGKDLLASGESPDPEEVMEWVLHATPDCLLPYFEK